MMDFIVLTASITMGILVAYGVGFIIMTNKKVMKFMVNYAIEHMVLVDDSLDVKKVEDL